MSMVETKDLKPESVGAVRYEVVKELIAQVLDYTATHDLRTDLPPYRQIVEISRWDHAPGCALGAVPACTCGTKIVRHFIKLPL